MPLDFREVSSEKREKVQSEKRNRRTKYEIDTIVLNVGTEEIKKSILKVS